MKMVTIQATELEEAGLMVKPANRSSSRHRLAHPRNLRLGNAREAHPWLTVEELRLDEDDADEDHEAYLYWDLLDLSQDMAPAESWQSLWEVLRLSDASPHEIYEFTERWGMLAGSWDGSGYGDRFGFDQAAISVDEWREFAAHVQDLMVLLATTAQGELVDEDFLQVIQGWDDLPDWPEEVAVPPEPSTEEIERWVHSLSATSVVEALENRMRFAEELRWKNLLSERQQGQGLSQQRRILARQLSGLMGTQYVNFLWDDRGRFMQTEAAGLDEIVFSHIASIFLAPEVDVLICSVCGTPFLFDESGQGRRPRYGVRRFCSDECRREGKRESNRLSWRRNSARWRRTRGTEKGSEDGAQG